MTREQRTEWLRRSIVAAIFIGIATGAWLYRENIARLSGTPQMIAPAPKHELDLLHFHLPGNPNSEQMADHLNALQTKYTGQILVTRIDVSAEPQRAAAERIQRYPTVLIMAGSSRELEIRGLWPRDRIEQRLEEILRGLRRMNKDWMPQGITRR
jgi:Thioredoxin